MRKIALAMIVLALTIPAMADVTITLDNDSNTVIVGYDCNEGEEVRAFALDIDVNDGAYVIGSGGFPGDPNTSDYYVCPTKMTFTVVGPNTIIDDFGDPMVEETNDGAVLEIASLYAASDPCHPSPPAATGDIATFAVDCTDRESVLVTITGENSKRGGVVLKDPNEAFTLVLPDPYDVPCGCACVGEVNGDNVVTPADLGVIAGWLNAYGVPSPRIVTIAGDSPHFDPCGDANRDGVITPADLGVIAGWLNAYGVPMPRIVTITCPHPY